MTTPEKIYYTPYGDIREDEPMTENDLVYVRPDAFIENAVQWLNCRLYDRVEVVNFGSTLESNMSKKEFVNEFRKYMKGEYKV